MVKSEKQRKHLEKLNKNRIKENHIIGTRSHGKSGYIREKCGNHPYSDDRGYVMQHRLVMERHIGRILTRKEVIHHINGNTKDNRIENLMLFSDNAKHMNSHKGTKKRYKTKKRIKNGEI